MQCFGTKPAVSPRYACMHTFKTPCMPLRLLEGCNNLPKINPLISGGASTSAQPGSANHYFGDHHFLWESATAEELLTELKFSWLSPWENVYMQNNLHIMFGVFMEVIELSPFILQVNIWWTQESKRIYLFKVPAELRLGTSLLIPSGMFFSKCLNFLTFINQ